MANNSRSNLQFSLGSSTQLETKPLILKETKHSSSILNKLSSLRKGPQRLWSTTLLALVAALTALIGGYTIGYPSSSLLDLNDLPDSRAIKNNSALANLYGALAPVGALFGGIVAGYLLDIIGRRPTLILTAIPYFIGWSMIAVSWFIHSPVAFKCFILIGRFISGFGLGCAMLSGPVYIGEISTPSLRGLYSSLPQLLLNVGILLVYGVGAIPHCKYYMTAFVACGILLVLLFGVVWLPETPRYLVSKNKVKKAVKTLHFLRGPKTDVQVEMIEIEEAIRSQKKLSCMEILKEMSNRSVYLPFLLMILVMVFQQLSGINALVFYGVHVLQGAGFGENSQYVALTTIGVTAVLFTFVSSAAVDFFGRKLLLMTSGIIMTLSSTGIGFAMRYHSIAPLAIISVIGFEVGFSIGFGAIPWVMIAELIPLRVRGVLGGILAAINWGLASIITGSYMVYASHVGSDFTWWTFAFLNGIGVGLVALFLPETKGKPLEVMEYEISNRYRLCI